MPNNTSPEIGCAEPTMAHFSVYENPPDAAILLGVEPDSSEYSANTGTGNVSEEAARSTFPASIPYDSGSWEIVGLGLEEPMPPTKAQDDL